MTFGIIEMVTPKTFLANLQLAVGVIVIVVIFFLLYAWSVKNVEKANDMRYQSLSLAEELRQSSNDLTRMVRTYVATNNPLYKKYYQDIIDIRNGTLPRPKNYDKMYWDFAMSGDTLPDATEATSLLGLMKKAGFSEQELQKLSASKSHSDKLTEIEFNAMKLLESSVTGDKNKALSILYDDTYHLAKSAIMTPISEVTSLVEKRTNLDEALDMIKRAVAARPDSGYIVDSLGWVLYRLGRHEEAVAHMEKAVELMPVDPVVNDHLGDVFWAVGRTMEAEFQWRRALSFIDPEDVDAEADPERIRRKLDVGLDQVLEEEGADPIAVANGG